MDLPPDSPFERQKQSSRLSRVLKDTTWWSEMSPEGRARVLVGLQDVDLDEYDDAKVLGAAEHVRDGAPAEWVTTWLPSQSPT